MPLDACQQVVDHTEVNDVVNGAQHPLTRVRVGIADCLFFGLLTFVPQHKRYVAVRHSVHQIEIFGSVAAHRVGQSNPRDDFLHVCRGVEVVDIRAHSSTLRVRIRLARIHERGCCVDTAIGFTAKPAVATTAVRKNRGLVEHSVGALDITTQLREEVPHSLLVYGQALIYIVCYLFHVRSGPTSVPFHTCFARPSDVTCACARRSPLPRALAV